MQNNDRTREQLVEEVTTLRHRVAELEKLEENFTQIEHRLKEELNRHRITETALKESKEIYRY